ncbi:MAG: 16S rRNA (adenine(1518)-N(6)/adenine(1519)-N(6))-dimethyltransferase RsmA [Gemmatimonadota bacterium]|nr:16S rRNA (adenine(1518)-N(6)/adenine(1519)-N(6))-dimethyltransferase RsmA [Gemmatimonadota bacterium]
MKAGAGLPPTLKRLGQHFLHDDATLDAIVAALGPIGDRTVVEIGPGRGVLTDKLAVLARRVVAIELDKLLAAHLRVRYASLPHITIIEADVLETSLPELGGDDYVLVGNVPYYITTPILFQALQRPRPTVAVYLVQREVAERMASPPGSRTYGALSVNVQAVANVELVRHVPPSAFHPPPSVDSAVIRIIPREDPAISEQDEAVFRSFVQNAFSFRRKQLGRVLRNILGIGAELSLEILAASNIAPDLRPEVLSPGDFARLVATIKTHKLKFS